jgi:hypothetical protein
MFIELNSGFKGVSARLNYFFVASLSLKKTKYKEEKEVATIVKKPRKDGVAYLFQVKLTNPLTAKKLVKTKTWNPPKSYTQKQAEREAVILADAWEKEVRAYYNVYNPHGELTPDSTFKEVAKKWLEKLEGQGSLSHLEGSKDYIKVVLPHIGKIKVGMLTQGIIQNLFDWVDKRERIIIKVRSKPKIVRKTMKNRNETYATMTNKHKIKIILYAQY